MLCGGCCSFAPRNQQRNQNENETTYSTQCKGLCPRRTGHRGCYAHVVQQQRKPLRIQQRTGCCNRLSSGISDAETHGQPSANIDELAGLTVNWIELQDSTMNVMMRDSTLRNDAVLTTDYFATADSIRAEIMRLALSEKRTMAEVVNLKINVSRKQGDLMQSEQMSEAKKFYLDFNKRIIQSAVDVRSQIAKRNGVLSDQQRSNYRWLLIQPFLVMDNYATAALTSQQENLLVEFAEQLPELLAALDGHTDQGDAEKLTSVLSEYFLKSYLKSVL